jgi:hypothetical protein
LELTLLLHTFRFAENGSTIITGIEPDVGGMNAMEKVPDD